jgi:pheromone a factor receptor
VVHFQYGASFGILTAAMVISRRLNHIVNITSVSHTKADKGRVILVDLALGLTLPIISMAWGKHPICLIVHPLLT